MEYEDHGNLDAMRTAQDSFHCGKPSSVLTTKHALANTLHTHHAEAVNYSFCKADISGQLKLLLELLKPTSKCLVNFWRFLYLFV